MNFLVNRLFYHDSLKYEYLEGEKLEQLEEHFASIKELLDKGITQFNLEFLENEVTGTYKVPGEWGRQKYMKYILTNPIISEGLKNYLIQVQHKYPLHTSKKRLRDDGMPDESLAKKWKLEEDVERLEQNVSIRKERIDEYNTKIEEYVKMNIDNINHKDPINEIKNCFRARRFAESEISEFEEKIALLRHQAIFGY